MDGRTSLDGDDFDRLMQLQGWLRQDFNYEATENNHNVIGQIRETILSEVTNCGLKGLKVVG